MEAGNPQCYLLFIIFIITLIITIVTITATIILRASTCEELPHFEKEAEVKRCSKKDSEQNNNKNLKI